MYSSFWSKGVWSFKFIKTKLDLNCMSLFCEECMIVKEFSIVYVIKTIWSLLWISRHHICNVRVLWTVCLKNWCIYTNVSLTMVWAKVSVVLLRRVANLVPRTYSTGSIFPHLSEKYRILMLSVFNAAKWFCIFSKHWSIWDSTTFFMGSSKDRLFFTDSWVSLWMSPITSSRAPTTVNSCLCDTSNFKFSYHCCTTVYYICF